MTLDSTKAGIVLKSGGWLYAPALIFGTMVINMN